MNLVSADVANSMLECVHIRLCPGQLGAVKRAGEFWGGLLTSDMTLETSLPFTGPVL